MMKRFGLMLALVPAVAASVTRDIEPDCSTALVAVTIQTYDGPVILEDVCYVSSSYADGIIRITVREYLSDGVFRSSFDH